MELPYLRALCGTWLLTPVCALKSLCRHTNITEHFALPHMAIVIGCGLHSSLSKDTDLGYHF